MNILTYDIEEWYIEREYHGNRKYMLDKFDMYLDQILEKLSEKNIKATFFCVGKMALYFPDVIRKISSEKHEIGCHSNNHIWLNQLSYNDLVKDTKEAVDALEQCIGEKIISYRAPAFSIGESNTYIFEILAECGITRDSSVFPAPRDFGGFPSFGYESPVIIKKNGILLHEYPIPMILFLGRKFAYSGGGYFRLFPISFIKNKMLSSDYVMNYFHIGDLIPDTHSFMSKKDFEIYFKQSGNLYNRYKRYIKENIGLKNAFTNMLDLIESFDFINLREADEIIDWKKLAVWNY